MAIIEVKNLKKEFKIKHKEPGLKGSLKSIFSPKKKIITAVNNVSFDVEKGELLAFIGPNGAGKSTTLKILTGILYPDKGDVKIMGLTPWKDRKKLSFKVGTIFGQKPQLWYHLPAIDTYNLFSKIYEMDKAEYQKRLKRLVKMLQVEEFLHTPVRKLSLGQRMRAELVASLLHKPEILFLDEPTIGLDIVAKKNLRNIIKKLNEEEGLTIILTSHDMEDIEKICKKLVVINRGRLIYKGKLSEVKRRFMGEKLLRIRFEEKLVKKFKHRGLQVLKQGEFGVKAKVDTTKYPIKKVLRELMEKYNIEDILVADPPIEEIIENIFKAKKRIEL
ncbi:ATP-binding cassette domain-containing protein [Candidatus Woesearchaeota archaeon]|nr:ATP-binding cassette domain-containing protein [Candidatus Woesearchaeota archaeon]